MVYYLYVHTVPNGKIYVGLCKDPIKRWYNGHGYFENKPFYRDIKKYGWNNIKHDIIDVFYDEEMAALHEKFYICLLDAENSEIGYNRTNYKKSFLNYFNFKTDYFEHPQKFRMEEYYNNNLFDEVVRKGELLSLKEYKKGRKIIRKFIVKYGNATYKLTKENYNWIDIYCLKKRGQK